ncbi:mandelate racemase/muconate lactonizing protein [Salinarchaeum sp. Harcht-Bsk1]|uniref:mandelate racemase/muconate lactonizing enzyme family protein n=1 Tax=Salinarchaeum sp. Harcht-Bsk1 TaxID=1333523 RepID=UPI00034243B3|nr:mandelate racemase/muconate lactonizing enzyme family protein [Salinarchaeum sp. Harcht-Bsk1]AGN01332.1 mandelate racemase/muconate lactonizing protein [Salinarchaeum sp. Harcht-Bsk1]
MKVTDVEAIPVAMEVLPESDPNGLAPYVTNHGQVETMERMLIRLETDSGVTGWGEMRSSLALETTASVIENDVAPELVGRSVAEAEAFADEFFYEYLDVGPFVGGVEMAMHDALGKIRGVPVHELLGGKTRDSVEFAYCVGILDEEDSREHARRALDGGYSVLKTKAGRDWTEDVRRILAMDDEADGELSFRLDPNQGWTPDQAVRVGAALGDNGVYCQYLEQPVRIDSVGTYESLRNRLRTPIAVNEDTYFDRNLFQHGAAGAIDCAVIDVVPAGGFRAAKRLAGVADDAGISLAHHNAFDLGVKTAAVLHLTASTPAINLPPDTIYYAWADDVIAEPFEVDDAEIEVPDGPGLGVDVDEGKLEQYRID